MRLGKPRIEIMENRRTKRWKDGRLVYYENPADKTFWDDQWSRQINPVYYSRYENGALDELDPEVVILLKKGDRILEAGCGPARFVVAMQSRGYLLAEGIDYAQETIDRVKRIYPDLPITRGDVLTIQKPDNYYDGYISLGVVEHREEGPGPFLREAFRVLKPGGFAFISVPYLNPLRLSKHYLGFYRSEIPVSEQFYQYAFQKTEFASILKSNGFDLLKSHGIEGLYGLRDELHPLFSFLDSIRGGSRLQQMIKKWKWINKFGHMILFICQKPFKNTMKNS